MDWRSQLLLRFEESVGDVELPRDKIIESWDRCVRVGLDPESLLVPYQSDVDQDGRLSWAAGAVIDRVANDLRGTPMALVLTDQRGQVLVRRAGTVTLEARLDSIQLATVSCIAKSPSAQTQLARRSRAGLKRWCSDRSILPKR